MTMQFIMKGNTLILKVLNSKSVAIEAIDKYFKSSFVRKHTWLLQIRPVEAEKEIEKLQPEISLVLQELQETFEEPVGLPPTRFCDHKIALKEGVTPVSVRPYRYPCQIWYECPFHRVRFHYIKKGLQMWCQIFSE